MVERTASNPAKITNTEAFRGTMAKMDHEARTRIQKKEISTIPRIILESIPPGTTGTTPAILQAKLENGYNAYRGNGNWTRNRLREIVQNKP